jgi:hypothetical protein
MPTRRTRLRCAAILRIRLGCQPTRHSTMGSFQGSWYSTRYDADTFSLANRQVMADFVAERGGGLHAMTPILGCLTSTPRP